MNAQNTGRKDGVVSDIKPSHLEAVLQLQRSYRDRKYRFMRIPLVERLRLELRLEVVGGRVVVWFTLLVLVCLNLFSTNDTAPYLFSLGRVIETELALTNSSTSETWGDVYESIESLSATLNALETGTLPLSAPSALEDFEVISSGSLSVSIPVVVDSSCSVSSSLTTLITGIYGPSSPPENLCAPLTSLSASTYMPQPANVTRALLEDGFVLSKDGTAASKPLMSLVLGELVTLNPATTLDLSFLLHMRSTDRLFLYRVSAESSGVSIEKFETVAQRSAYYHNMFVVTALAGIVVASFFLLKDVLVFAVNVYVWTRERERYIAHRVSGVIGTRRKMVIWMTANLVTNTCMLVLLAGRYSSGDTIAIVSDLALLCTDFRAFAAWESYGVVCVYILLARVVHSLSGHPRVGILTATWRMAFDDIAHLVCVFVILFFSQAVIGLLLMWNRSAQMTTYVDVTLSQWRSLVAGVWDSVSADIDVNGQDWIVMLYFVAFLVTTRVLLLNFFIAVQIDAYMAVREHVVSHSTAQSFLADAVETAQAKLLVKLGYIPNRQKIIAMLVHMYAKPEVGRADLSQGWAFVDEKQVNLFCQRYWFKYPQVREQTDAAVASDWRTVLAEIEVLRDLITPPSRPPSPKAPN